MNDRILRIALLMCAFKMTASAQLAAWGDYLRKEKNHPLYLSLDMMLFVPTRAQGVALFPVDLR